LGRSSIVAGRQKASAARSWVRCSFTVGMAQNRKREARWLSFCDDGQAREGFQGSEGVWKWKTHWATEGPLFGSQKRASRFRHFDRKGTANGQSEDHHRVKTVPALTCNGIHYTKDAVLYFRSMACCAGHRGTHPPARARGKRRCGAGNTWCVPARQLTSAAPHQGRDCEAPRGSSARCIRQGKSTAVSRSTTTAHNS